MLALGCPLDITLDVSGCYLGLLRVSRGQLWGKGEAAKASGLGEAGAIWSCGGEADKAGLAFPSSNTGNGLTGKPGQLLEEQGR